MVEIVTIQLSEKIQLDQTRLDALYAQLGPSGADTVVCRTMEELAVRMKECEAFWRSASHAQLRKHARSLIAISDQIGMYLLAKVAADVTACIDAQDDIALAATLSRMLRIGERSLSALWAMEDLRI